ncbi:MAG: TIGR03087 family PEP-CTERM/XrtA system glycosyltransferase [Burkholderiales bacterium]
MGNLLYLVHRMPYPPNKGDKVRSYHLLKHLAARHRVFLGTFMDDPEDQAHIATLRSLCADVHVEPLHPKRARVNSLLGLFGRRALTLRYYRNQGLHDWVARVTEQHQIQAAVVFSSSMAQYVEGGLNLGGAPVLVDFVDVDSAKWSQYAKERPWPLSWLYRREGRTLLNYEREVALWARRSFFVTESETALFKQLAPTAADKVEAVSNGVDAQYFTPEPTRRSPYSPGEQTVVFTGAMDYWPNVDAVTWFARDILPDLRKQWPQLRFYIVGRSPDAAVQALTSEAVVVTGTVPDVRPYLQHADVVVAPLRLARGIQNKILEAMAMGRPVVASSACASALNAQVGQDEGSELVAAKQAADYVQAIGDLLTNREQAARIGAAGRSCVLQRYSWSAHLAGVDKYLNATNPRVGVEPKETVL